MDTLLKEISKYPNGTELIAEWANGCVVHGNIDTIYETDNELEMDDKNYEEFHAFLLYVTDISVKANEKQAFKKGDFIEVSMQNPPQRILLSDKEVVWESKW